MEVILSSQPPPLIDHIMHMLQVDYVALVIAIATIAVSILAIKKFIDEFSAAFGFVPIWTRKKIENQKEKEQILNRLDILTETQQELKEMQKNDKEYMETLSSCLTELKNDISQLDEKIGRRERDKEFRRLRWRIINFANELPGRETITREVWNEVWDGVRKYEEMCTKYGYINGQTTSSVRVIAERYEHDIANGKIID